MNKWFTSLIAILTVTGLRAQQPVEVPKLVVSIVVDQLRGDYLHYFGPTFGEKGFKRLLNEGLVYHQVQYEFPNVGQASSIATLYTGTNPYYHGIVADKKYDFEKKREVSVIYDESFIGNYTSENASPMALMSSTIGDELKIASGGKSDVYAIAPDAVGAILSAGRMANAAFWLENYNGKWATTTYYKNIPWYVDRYNTSEAIGNNPERVWMPALSQYTAFPYTKNALPFKYEFLKSDKDKFLKIKQSPFVNTEVTNLVAKFFEYADFGKRTNPDLLSITYYAGDYKGSVNGEYGSEIQDIYYRLDKEIERVLDLVDKKVGLSNALIVLTSTGYYDAKSTLPEGSVPAGEFYPNRCTALLNMYLMALYGQGQWVEGYYNDQIYLNKKLIENQKIVWSDILHKAAEFIAQFSGVQDVTTSGQWMVDDAGRASAFRRGVSKKISGDIFLELQPGWVVMNEQSNQTKYIRNNAIISPLIFFGARIPKQNVYRIVRATEIAPTITHVLRIRPPNASKEIPLQEFLNY